MSATGQRVSLTFDDGMLFAFGLCARRTEMVGVPCRRPVVDGGSDVLSPESRYCTTHQTGDPRETR